MIQTVLKCEFEQKNVAAFYIDLSTTGVMDITHLFPLTFICIINQILADQLDFTTRSTRKAPLLRFHNKLFVCRKRARDSMGIFHKCHCYCTSASCRGAITYCIDETNIHANRDGTGIAYDLRCVAVDISWATNGDCTYRGFTTAL